MISAAWFKPIVQKKKKKNYIYILKIYLAFILFCCLIYNFEVDGGVINFTAKKLQNEIVALLFFLLDRFKGL